MIYGWPTVAGTSADIPGLDDATFQKHAADAKRELPCLEGPGRHRDPNERRARIVQCGRPSCNSNIPSGKSQTVRLSQRRRASENSPISFRNSQAASECQRSEEHTSELQSPDHLVCRL